MPPEVQPGESVVDAFAKGVEAAPPVAPPDAGAPPSTEDSTQGPPASAPAPAPVEPEDKGDVPYTRFAEVNGKFRDSEKAFEEYKSGSAKREEDRAFEIVNGMAENNPALQKALLGETEPAAPATPPPDPDSTEGMQATIASLRKDADEGKQWRANQDESRAIQNLESRVVTETSKYENLKDPAVKAMAEEMIGGRLLSNRDAAPEEVVKQVSEALSGLKELHQRGYVQGKENVAAAVPPGAGGSGGTVVTEAPAKLSLDDKSAMRAFAAGLEANQQ